MDKVLTLAILVSLCILPATPSSILISNGTAVSDLESSDWSWIVSICIDGIHQCGGSLVSSEFVLTAAHCVDGETKAADLLIRLGQIDFDRPSRSGVNSTVSQFFKHSNWNNGSYQSGYDIALLQLSQPVQFSRSIRTIELSPADLDTDNKDALVAGWGMTETEISSRILRYTKVTMREENNCTWLPNTRRDIQICAGFPRLMGDACQGDSGGPLVLAIDGRWILSGIVSYGSAVCGGSSLPGYYTRVSSFLGWIVDNIGPIDRRMTMPSSHSLSRNNQTISASTGKFATFYNLLILVCFLALAFI